MQIFFSFSEFRLIDQFFL